MNGSNRKIKTAVFVTFLLLAGNPANANLIDLDDYTVDSRTGLDWLDVTLTKGGSFNYISGQLGQGGSLEGWRYATLTELLGLIETATGVVGLTNDTSVFLPQQEPVIGLVSLLGEEVFFDIPESGFQHHTFGLLDGAGYTASGVMRGQLTWYEYNSIAFLAYNSIPTNANVSYGHMGSFLVRRSENASAVPLPGTLYLMLSGAMLLITVARRR